VCAAVVRGNAQAHHPRPHSSSIQTHPLTCTTIPCAGSYLTHLSRVSALLASRGSSLPNHAAHAAAFGRTTGSGRAPSPTTLRPSSCCSNGTDELIRDSKCAIDSDHHHRSHPHEQPLPAVTRTGEPLCWTDGGGLRGARSGGTRAGATSAFKAPPRDFHPESGVSVDSPPPTRYSVDQPWASSRQQQRRQWLEAQQRRQQQQRQRQHRHSVKGGSSSGAVPDKAQPAAQHSIQLASPPPGRRRSSGSGSSTRVTAGSGGSARAVYSGQGGRKLVGHAADLSARMCNAVFGGSSSARGATSSTSAPGSSAAAGARSAGRVVHTAAPIVHAQQQRGSGSAAASSQRHRHRQQQKSLVLSQAAEAGAVAANGPATVPSESKPRSSGGTSSAAAATSAFKSMSRRDESALVRRGEPGAPGPAYYRPALLERRSFHAAAAGRSA